MNSYGVFRGVMGLEGHIMSNFSFLLGQDDYEQFAIPCVEAEKAFSISPTMCAMATRKAFELAVKGCTRRTVPSKCRIATISNR